MFKFDFDKTTISLTRLLSEQIYNTQYKAHFMNTVESLPFATQVDPTIVLSM